MLLDTYLMRIQKVAKVSELVSYLVHEMYVVRLAASSRLEELLRESDVEEVC